jgi:LCP family protein required for cell wall assembly
MKQFFKVFLVSLLIFSMVVFTGIFTYVKFFDPEGIAIEQPNLGSDNEDEDNNTDFDTPLDKAIKSSKRVNVLLLGLEGLRSDTIMIASYDRLNKKVDIISIPRDTYYPRDEYSKYSEFMKINAVYGTDDRRQDALVDAVEDMTGIPIDKYVSIDYEGVRAAVDAVGGVEFDVPFRMKYTDPYDTPPLYINIQAGNQIIYGDKAMEFLRFRKGDPGYPGYAEGDVGRIQTQQEFIKAAIGKALSLKLPSVISSVYPYVKTNFTLTELLGLSGDVIGFSKDNINTSIMPGEAKYMGGLSFYIPDGEEITKLLYNLYGIQLTNDTENE